MKTCRSIVSEEGLSAVNMRHVAEKCSVASGSLYHYFPSKDVMLSATVESVWYDIFHMDEGCSAHSLTAYIEWLYRSVDTSREEYPNFSISHSLSFAASAKQEAHNTMMRCFAHIKNGMIVSLHNDADVRQNAFNTHFTEEAFIDFIFSSFLASMVQGKNDSSILIEMIKRTIY